MIKERADVAVVGAGPAGLAAARCAVDAGLDVLLLEKHERIGQLINCAEGLTRKAADTVIGLRPEWIRSNPKTGRLIAPNGTVFDLHHEKGAYVIDRRQFQMDLADDLKRDGVRVLTGRRAVALERSGDLFTRLRGRTAADESFSVEARAFVAADGVEGSVARTAGIDNHLNIAYTETLLQYRIGGAQIDTDVMAVYLGRQIAPRAYAWVFPISSTEANVGLGVPSHFGPKRPVRVFLDTFVERHFPEARILAIAGGTCPRYGGRNLLARKNLFVAGAAARLLDSLSGGGIVHAYRSGQLAGRASAELVSGRTNPLEGAHAVYPGMFLDESERELDWMLKARRFFNKLSDEELNDVVKAARIVFGDKPVASVDIFSAVKDIIRKKPRLLALARHIIF